MMHSNMMHSDRKPLPGSHREPAPGAHSTGERFSGETIEVTIRLRRKPPKELPFRATLLGASELGALPLKERRYLRREEYAGLCGASSADLEAVRAFAKQFHLVEVGSIAGGRSLKFKGSASDMSEAFGTTLETYNYPYGKYRGRVNELYLPSEVYSRIEGVFGLDNRKQSKPLNPQPTQPSYPTQNSC